jgi:timeless
MASHFITSFDLQDPSDVALSVNESSIQPISKAPAPVIGKGKNKGKPIRTITTTKASTALTIGANSLRVHLQCERQKLQLSAQSRHSHFGGTLMISKPGGKQSYVSATDYLAQKSGGTGGHGVKGSAIGQPVRRKNKKAEVFVGSGKSSALNARPGASAAFSRETAGPIAKRAKLALNSFCEKFMGQCYGPVMKSLKNEFRRDSNRLEDGDRTMFFRIVWFFHQWWRVRKQNGGFKDDTKAVTAEGGEDVAGSTSSMAQNLIFTMDVFMFNLVLNSTDEFFEHKKPAELAQTVSLYTEMIHMLHAMYDSEDSTERMMALGLMDRIYYAAEPLDRLPKLLSRWTPGMFSREYLCDLVECSHVTWKLLDGNAERCLQSLGPDELERKRPKDAVERMNLTASEFDKDAYFMRKFVSNHIVFMHTQLLSQYAVNAAHINRHIAAYFIRLCKFSIKQGDGDLDYDDVLGKNELASKQATLEPMLYNIGLFTVMEAILNDQGIRDKEDFSALLMFASSFMKRFARASEANPMLFVEALFKHPIPHRFCEFTTNMYVNEELRMIAVRDLLLEDQKRYEQQSDEDGEDRNNGKDGVVAGNDGPGGYASEDEEEVEFNGDDLDEGEFVPGKKRRKRSTKRGSKRAAVSALMREEEEQPGDDGNGEEAEFGGDNEQSETAEETMGRTSLTKAEAGDQSNVAEANAAPPKSSGKKRIRKSSVFEESDDEDFDTVPAKSMKRAIFEDDEDD